MYTVHLHACNNVHITRSCGSSVRVILVSIHENKSLFPEKKGRIKRIPNKACRKHIFSREKTNGSLGTLLMLAKHRFYS